MQVIGWRLAGFGSRLLVSFRLFLNMLAFKAHAEESEATWGMCSWQITRALEYRPLFLSCLLKAHWPKQVTWPTPRSWGWEWYYLPGSYGSVIDVLLFHSEGRYWDQNVISPTFFLL